MLQFLRKRAQSFVIQAIVVIIALVFIFWGVGANLMNRQEAAIVVNGEEITFQQFQQAYDQTYNRLAEQFGGSLPKGLADSLNLKQQVISQLTQEALLRQSGLEAGLRVSSVEIQNQVESMVQFQENGRFAIERYKTILAANRTTPTKFEDSLRHDLLADKTMNAIADFALTATDFEIEELYKLENETVTVSFVTLSPENYQADVDVSEEEITQWYSEAGERYKTDKEIKLTYLPFTYSDIGSKVTVEEDAITGYYDQHLTEYQIPEKRRARHILFKAGADDSEDIHRKKQELAEQVLEKARAGTDFAELAEQYSEGPTAATGGDLGFFTDGQMVKPFNDAVFDMQEGEISGVVKTDFGYHLIKLEEIQLAGIRTLEETRDEIETALRLEQAKPLAFQVANEAYENIISAGSLGAFIESHPETKVVETTFFSQDAPASAIPNDPDFLDKIFALKEGELSSLLEVPNGYAVVYAEAVKQPEVPELSEVRTEVEADFKREKADEKARAAAEQLISKLQDGSEKSFEELAQEQNLSLQESGPLSKNAQAHDSPFPQSLVQQVFRLSSSEPVAPEPGLVDDSYYVFKFLKREEPQEPMTEEERQRYKELLMQYKQQQIVEAWLKNQQVEADIRIHNSLENF